LRRSTATLEISKWSAFQAPCSSSRSLPAGSAEHEPLTWGGQRRNWLSSRSWKGLVIRAVKTERAAVGTRQVVRDAGLPSMSARVSKGHVLRCGLDSVLAGLHFLLFFPFADGAASNLIRALASL
jgi:hypothetical protein